MITQSLRTDAFLTLTLLLAVFAPAFADPQSNRLVVFGDSLSDPGNHFFTFGQVSEAPFAPVPSAPYDEGGHHFSNGPTWIERLTQELDTAASGRPALVKPGVNTNYAFGSARARPNAAPTPTFNFAGQVGMFLNDFRGQAPGNYTYVIWMGANDLDDAVNALKTDPSGRASSDIVQAALGAMGTNIRALWTAGARSFFVVNLPDLGLTPALLALGPAAAAAGTQLTTAYNTGLVRILGQLQVLPQVKFTTLDVFGLLHTVVANPAAFGFKDTQSPCLTFFVVNDAICSRPDQHLFWDGIHPTTAAHEIVGQAAKRSLQTSPMSGQ